MRTKNARRWTHGGSMSTQLCIGRTGLNAHLLRLARTPDGSPAKPIDTRATLRNVARAAARKSGTAAVPGSNRTADTAQQLERRQQRALESLVEADAALARYHGRDIDKLIDGDLNEAGLCEAEDGKRKAITAMVRAGLHQNPRVQAPMRRTIAGKISARVRGPAVDLWRAHDARKL